jgi:PBSX family phage terminase large subunit
VPARIVKPLAYTPPSTLTHSFRPRGVARDLFYSHAAEVLVSGPAGTGKSRACLEKLHTMALTFPGMRALIVRKTATSLTSTALVTFRRDVISEALLNGTVIWYGGNSQQPAQYRYTNESAIVVGGMDNSTRIMSSEYDVVYVQEATELGEDDWEKLTTRLRSNVIPYQQIIADCNPDMPTHWLKQRADAGRTVMLESRHEDNPTLFADDGKITPGGADYIAKLDNLTGVRHSRLRRGLWVAAEGIIFEDWDPAVHLVDDFDVPDSWSRWWSVDFGFTNPFVWQNWAEDPDGRLFLAQEIYRTARLVEDHAEEITALTEGQPRPQGIVCDHDAEGRATLERHVGMSTRPAHKSVLEGIEGVQLRIRQQRLFIMRGALTHRDAALIDAKRPACTAEEIPGYVWLDPSKAKEGPVKDNDHGCDAMRYVVAERDLYGTTRMRWLP